MIMKLLFKHTTSLLRSALLLGALALITIPTQAQTAGLPDAFETMVPGDIIGDDNYYYVQFYDHNRKIYSYLTDCGVDQNARTKDFLPYANNRLWTLVDAGDGDANHFKLKNKDGHYLYFGSGGAARVKCVDNVGNASILSVYSLGDGYDISAVGGNPMYRNGTWTGSTHIGNEWDDLPCNVTRRSSYYNSARLRFVQLKSNSAFIIYYRGEGIDNDNPGAETTRHYLTYSGTAESSLGTNWWWSNVSSRQSIIPNDMPLSDLPTLAAYHKDGLWTIEKAEVEGQFYIKKYGTNQYLNEDYKWDDVYGSELGNKDATKGTYTLETPSANRYTRVQNVKYDSEVQLTAGMFFEWDGYGAGAAKTSEDAATVSWNMGSEQAGGATIAGTGWVDYLTYADLSEYQRMTINGTAGTQMRVMLNRQESNNGSWAEKNVTIGSDGKAVVDLSYIELNHVVGWVPEVKMTYVNGSDADANTSYGQIAWGDAANCGFNKIENGEVKLANKGWGVNNLAYLQVDVSDFTGVNGTIRSVTLEGEFQQISARELAYGVGYNNSTWSSDLTWNTADRTITTMGSTQSVVKATTDQWLSFDITDAFRDGSGVRTILVYQTVAGGGYIKNPRVKVEYEPTVKEILPYAHLNAIKIAYGSPAGTVSSITLAKKSNTDVRYLHHAQGDGWQVLQWPDDPTTTDHWYAGFYPVEVLSPNEDNLYQAVLMKDGKMLGSQAKLKTYNDINLEGWTVEQVGDYQHFKLKNSAGQYYKSNEVVTLDASEARVFTISELTSEAGTGFYTSQFIPKTETRILHDVTHKLSNVKKLYYDDNPTSPERQKVYSQQGLITNDLSEWLNSDGTQKVNEFKITHYVKKGETLEFGLPTTLRTYNDHVLYQRWYNYQNDRDLDGLKSRFSVSSSAGTVMDYLYNNGMVTGVRFDDLPDWLKPNADGKMIDWPTVFPGTKTYVSHLFTYKNSDGQNFTLAADVSRYNDFAYQNSSSPLDGNLQEPSLTMRYIYYMKDAKEMATMLSDCAYNSDKWLEKKTFHFPAKRLAYETQKQAEYQGEFIGIKHNFKDYWVFNGSGTGNENLVSAVIDDTSGRIEVVIDDAGSTGISKGGHNSEGYYLYDEGNKRNNPITRLYGESRFIVFNYPGETVNNAGDTHKAYIKVYFNYGGTRYQIALFEIIFDEDKSTLPWTDTDAEKRVQGSYRDPKNLVKKAGEPIAKITFDYPEGATFKNSSEIALHNLGYMYGQLPEIVNSSPVPLTFGKTNYGFDGDNPSWGSYALVKTMETVNGYSKTALPVNHATYGYGIAQDEGMESAFLYIDASEQPGEICSVPFYGEFCAGDKLMCSGWISGSNKINNTSAYHSPGSVILTVKGKNTGEDEEPIYRFCPGQCYELDQGDYVNWQQFYFEFNITKKYEQYWVEVNNNCVSSQGGDFMLDNIEVYAFVPEATPVMNTPICINKTASEMQLLKVSLGFEKILSAIGATEVTGDANGEDKSYAFVYLDKNVFLTTFQSELSSRYSINKTIAQLESIIKTGEYGDKAVTDYLDAYKAAFNAAVLGNYTKIWDSNSPDNNPDAAVLNFHWNTNFSKMESYTFAKAVTKQGAVFAETDSETGERMIVMNGNYSNQLPWKVNTDYYIVPYDHGVTTALSGNDLYVDFNIWSMCNKKKVFQIKPPLNILSMESSDVTQDLEVCEGKIPTLLTDLKGYTVNGVEVSLTGLSFDWWLGDLSANPKVLATLDNYHSQTNAAGSVRLDEALGTLRVYYPDVTSLEGLTEKLSQTPNLTAEMVFYLQELVDKGQLILHQRTISIPAQKASDDDPYFYLVACPIHDGYFDKALNIEGSDDVAYFCDEPQGLRMKVSEKAPSLKCGFVPNENGFESYHYPEGNPILSIRLAKKAQFETVKHGSTAEEPKAWESNSSLNYLWMPIRDAKVESTNSSKVIVKSDDYNVYLASTDDPEWDKTISTEMTKVNITTQQWVGSLPIVGKIVKLNAIDTSKNSGMTEKNENRLCIYFTENFDVREGYNYTLSLPFREDGDTNACDGTLLINLKIVPDYEVWTGGAGNTDWNNDENWRRADCNPENSGLNQDELYKANAAKNSPLYGDKYKTNEWNYRTPKDRLFRKGFAPLYCTHILMKSDEWGNAPVLYDAFAGKSSLDAAPFPNLSENVKTLVTSVEERFDDIDALVSSGQAFAIVNEAEGKALYGINDQNLGSANYATAYQNTNTGYYFKIESVTGGYLLRLQTPAGQPYTIWGSPGYLNSQPSDTDRPEHCCFILGLNGQNGQDAENHAVWTLEPDGNGKFALMNVGTNKYLKDNSWAVYNDPTYFTLCTLKKETVTTTEVKDNILKYDMQARIYDIWSETYGIGPDKGREGDLIAEMYQINSCDEIAFQPTTELLNAHLLNYNSAWVEYQLDNKRWYLLGSPLQGTISGEWYAPTGTAKQQTTYYDPVTFGTGYDRYSPAIYQRSWDQAKAVLYEVGSIYSTADDNQAENLGSADEGIWSGTENAATWIVEGGGTADEYLDRLGYKPMGGKKANVAIEGVWSNTYNDAQVDYANGGFSVMVMNHLKNNDTSNGTSVIRLPKEDTKYDYYLFSEDGSDDGGTDTNLSDVRSKDRAKNRGRLKTDLLLPTSAQKTESAASIYGDARKYTRIPIKESELSTMLSGIRNHTEDVSAGASNLGYYLVENPFPCGLNMDAFFAGNTGLETKYWLLTATGQHLVQKAANGDWINLSGTSFAADDAVLAPGQGFFVKANTAGQATTITFNKDMQAQSRFGKKDNGTSYSVVIGTKLNENGEIENVTDNVKVYNYVQDTGGGKVFPLKTRGEISDTFLSGLVITAKRGDSQSSALVMQLSEASNDFLPEEDTETFINSDIKHVPTVYTLCGRLATTINSIHDFRSLSLGVESNSEAPCVLTFKGVELLGDSVAFYDAVEKTLTPLESGMTFSVSGQTQNRYYLVRSLDLKEAAEETHLQIFTEGLTAKVIASTAEPITVVRCFDTAGRMLYTANPDSAEHSFTLPRAGIYIIEAQTEHDRKTKKVMTK